MKSKAGIWIDHRKALIVVITGKEEEIKLVISNVEKQPGRFEGKRSTTSYESQLVPADDSSQKKLTGHLNIFYEAVIASVRDTESILIFGPGEAKGELKKRLIRDKLDNRIVAIETIDRMTDRQIAAKVRKYFKEKTGRQKK